MWYLFGRVASFFAGHRFSLEIGSLAIGGITIPELVAADHALKILIGIVTLFLIVRKEVKNRKKES